MHWTLLQNCSHGLPLFFILQMKKLRLHYSVDLLKLTLQTPGSYKIRNKTFWFQIQNIFYHFLLSNYWHVENLEAREYWFWVFWGEFPGNILQGHILCLGSKVLPRLHVLHWLFQDVLKSSPSLSHTWQRSTTLPWSWWFRHGMCVAGEWGLMKS